MDAHTFIANMSQPSFQVKRTHLFLMRPAASLLSLAATWELYYSSRATYGALLASPPSTTASLNASFWHEVTEVFASNTSAFNDYIARMTRGFDAPACDAACATTTICDLRAMRSENNCDVTTPGISFKREVDAPEVARGECESVMGSMMRRMVRARR
jgi:sphingomyelin phosphodiesterase